MRDLAEKISSSDVTELKSTIQTATENISHTFHVNLMDYIPLPSVPLCISEQRCEITFLKSVQQLIIQIIFTKVFYIFSCEGRNAIKVYLQKIF